MYLSSLRYNGMLPLFTFGIRTDGRGRRFTCGATLVDLCVVVVVVVSRFFCHRPSETKLAGRSERMATLRRDFRHVFRSVVRPSVRLSASVRPPFISCPVANAAFYVGTLRKEEVFEL